MKVDDLLTGSRVDMALHILLDITLPTIVILRGMHDEFQHSARPGANSETLPVNGEHDASGAPAARELEYHRQLLAAIKSLWLGCPAEVSDVTIEPFAWWLEDAHVLVQIIVWCGALELIAFGLQRRKEGQEEPGGDDPARPRYDSCVLGADLTMVLPSSPADRELHALYNQLRPPQTGAVADGCQEG
ncbi:hypothetical protein ABBQ38_008344 [Trebouxia sp. C0009 RCD-2024]